MDEREYIGKVFDYLLTVVRNGEYISITNSNSISWYGGSNQNYGATCHTPITEVIPFFQVFVDDINFKQFDIFYDHDVNNIRYSIGFIDDHGVLLWDKTFNEDDDAKEWFVNNFRIRK